MTVSFSENRGSESLKERVAKTTRQEGVYHYYFNQA